MSNSISSLKEVIRNNSGGNKYLDGIVKGKQNIGSGFYVVECCLNKYVKLPLRLIAFNHGKKEQKTNINEVLAVLTIGNKELDMYTYEQLKQTYDEEKNYIGIDSFEEYLDSFNDDDETFVYVDRGEFNLPDVLLNVEGFTIVAMSIEMMFRLLAEERTLIKKETIKTNKINKDISVVEIPFDDGNISISDLPWDYLGGNSSSSIRI
jgi:hypothetical protein